MKAKPFSTIVLLFALTAFLVGAVSAQGPGPQGPSALPETPPAPEGFSLPGPEGRPFAVRPQAGMGTQSTGAAAVPLGQPGLSFRYVQTFGVTEQAYIPDTQHLNYPTGLFVDAGNHLYVTEEHGARVLKYRISDGANLLTIGTAGLRIEANSTFGQPRDVAVDGSGNIWVADNNRVVQYNAGGVYQQQVGVPGQGSDNAHFSYVVGVAFDSAGRLYVSDTDNHRIQVYTFTVEGAPVYSTTIGVTGVPGDDNGHFRWPARIAIDSQNRLYVVDSGNQRVQRCSYAGGWSCATFHGTGSAGNGPDQLNWPWGVGVDNSDNVYIADTWNYRVKKCNSAGSCSIFVAGSGRPTDVAADSAGYVYVCDGDEHVIEKYSSSGSYQGVFAGTSGVPYLTDGSHFNDPVGVAVDNGGNIYLTEGLGYRAVKMSGGWSVQWAVGTPGVWGGDNSHFGDWRDGPGHIAVDGNGNVYIADPGNYRVQIYNRSGGYVATLGSGYGSGNYQFFRPNGVAVDGNGNIYVADTYNHRVQIYNSNRQYLATLGVTGVAGEDNVHFRWPFGVAVDSGGNIYVADTYNCRVQVYDSSRTYKRTLGTTGRCGDDFAHFMAPYDVAVDAQGRLYVADTGNNRVQVFDGNGAYLTTIGGAGGAATGQFRNPFAVDVDGSGNVYVADRYNHRIQKFAPGVPGWKQVNINGFGERWNDFVSTLDGFGGQLYAGTWSGQVWRAPDGQTWSQFTPSWSASTTAVFDTQAFGSNLYVGTASDGGGEIWRTNGIDWTRVVSGGFGDVNNDINAFAVFSDAIYAATANLVTGVEVWRSANGDVGSWTQVNVDSFGVVPVTTTQDIVMEVYDGYLYIGFGRYDSTWKATAELWRTGDGTTWTPVFTDGLAANNTQVSAMAEFNGALYIGLRNVATGGEVWRSSDGLQWTNVFTGGLGNPNNQRPYGLISFDGFLYLVFSNLATGAEVWRSADGATWEQVMAGGWGDINNYFADYFDKGAAVFGNRLFIGTVNWANGGEVWLYLHKQVYLPLVLRNP